MGEHSRVPPRRQRSSRREPPRPPAIRLLGSSDSDVAGLHPNSRQAKLDRAAGRDSARWNAPAENARRLAAKAAKAGEKIRLLDSFGGLTVLGCGTCGNEANRFLAQLDFKLIARLKVQHGGVGLANEQVAIALNLCHIAELAATLANCSSATAEINAFGLEKRLVERSEVQAVASILLIGYIATSSNQIGFGNIAQVLDLCQEFRASEHWN